MQLYQIGILCIQEIWTKANDHFITDSGSLVILSGTGNVKSAGVGFIIAPSLRKAVHSFDCLNARMAVLKFRIHGGKIVFISVYAPQSAHIVDDRLIFFHAT